MPESQRSWEELARGQHCYLCQPRESSNEYRRETRLNKVYRAALFRRDRGFLESSRYIR